MSKKKAGRPVIDWPPEKIVLLKKIYPSTSNEAAAKKIGVTVSALRNAAVRFRVKKSTRYWDKAWEDALLKHWDSLTVQEIERLLKDKFSVEKTKWAIINKHRELKKIIKKTSKNFVS